ncbi:site-specific DNA-methyltransferase [Candidatus Aerophobetes bacterium]|nr:site-specific DNA-methyltransferase [Candidatus Aerophobetes bacterium]
MESYKQQVLDIIEQNIKLITPKEAARWATEYLKKNITVSNIAYLIQYGRLKNYGSNGNPLIDKDELKDYYDSFRNELYQKSSIFKDINWHLSFSEYKESERTKHVHRLHPYKGKFIPQLVEYFLDSHTDEFKKEVYFKKDDIVLDPFCGSGTTLVQANELGIHAVGIDVSYFNSLISNIKIKKHEISKIYNEIKRLTDEIEDFNKNSKVSSFENELNEELSKFNNKYFPSSDFKIAIRNKEIDENKYANERLKDFLPLYYKLVNKYSIKLKQDREDAFIDKWFLSTVRDEIEFMKEKVLEINDKDVKNVIMIILSRTVRSCRATTHSDLATLKEPVFEPYYCKKHGKICKPIFSIINWWKTYTVDTIKRLREFEKIRTDTFQICLTGDSKAIDIFEQIKNINPDFANILINKKFRGIFSSPPYVGLIDYHEQHAYAYEMFGFERRDELEIGPLYKGQGEEAKMSYIKGIADVLKNCKRFLQKNYDIFLVANDKFNLYPKIAELAGMRIVEEFKRPVLNRVEKNRETLYSESIFHLKEK